VGGRNESAQYWLGVLNEIKNRGVKDIIIVLVTELTGIGDALHAVFQNIEIRRCIVLQILYTTKFISYKDTKVFMKDLMEVYQAPTEDIALQESDILEENGVQNIPVLLLPGKITGRHCLHISSIRLKCVASYIPQIR
jgi:transposase-like protein